MIVLFSILVILVIIILIGMSGFKKQYNDFFREVDREYERIGNTDLSDVPDGAYRYRYGRTPVFVDLSIHIKNHAIDTVIIHKQSSGPGYDARETVDRMLERQLVKVDVVSGATISSKCIMIAGYKALASAGDTP
jgi:uncharacterized protein with FMN-binding domain